MTTNSEPLDRRYYYDRGLLCSTYDGIAALPGTAFALLGIENYSKCLKSSSENKVEILIRRAILYSRVGKVDEAKADLRAVMPQIVEVPSVRSFFNAQILTSGSISYSVSSKVFDPLLSDDPLDDDFEWNRKDVTRNRPAFKAHIGSDSENIQELTAFACVALSERDYATALETVDQILAIEPQNLPCHIISAHTSQLLEDYEARDQHLLSVSKIVGDCAEYWLLRANLRKLKTSIFGWDIEIVKDLTNVMEDRGLFGDLCFERANRLTDHGLYLEAAKDFQYVISNMASFRYAWWGGEWEVFNAAVVSALMGKLYSEAFQLLKDIEKEPWFQGKPYEHDLLLYRYFVKVKLKDLTAADDLKEAKRLNPGWRNQRAVDSYLKKMTEPPAEESDDSDQDNAHLESQNIFVQQGDTWKVKFHGGKVVHLKNLQGMKHIHRLLSRQGMIVDAKSMPRESVFLEELPALQLDGDKPRNTMRSIESLDKKAREAYKKRLGELSDARRAAELNSDREEIAKINKETRDITEQLTGSYEIKDAGLGYASTAVRNAIDRAIENISKYLPELGLHFQQFVRTGSTLSYNPPEMTDWILS